MSTAKKVKYFENTNKIESDNEQIDSIAIVEDDKEAQLQDFTSEQLRDALFFVEDLMGRSHMRFLVLGDTLTDVLRDDKDMECDYIHLGIRENELTKYGMSTFETYINKSTYCQSYDMSANQITFTYKEVPIVIDILDKDLRIFANPDRVFFFATEFDTPNPTNIYFEEYHND